MLFLKPSSSVQKAFLTLYEALVQHDSDLLGS